MHNTQIWSGLQADGSYCFDSFFPEVRDLIMEGDYSSINFEAAMAGPDSAYTGYPLFNSPDAMAQTLQEAGFDLVVTANNHSLDRGVEGAIRTLEVLRQAGLDTLGTYKNEKDSHTYLIKDIKGIKVAYLAYTYGTNGIPLPDKYSFLVNFLDENKILADIKVLRPQVDVLVLVLHWGLEYNPRPTDIQNRQAYSFLEAGADLILGSHPHVIQTMENVKIENKDKFVIYSMGNFISHQIGQERNSGIVLKAKFTKDFSSGITLLDEVSYTPTFSHSYQEAGKTKFRVVPVEKTIDRIEEGKETILNKNHLPLLQSVLASTRSQLGEGF
ncbi:MAG: CapA family protein, partial [Syntrophomonas sp.]|nr:CapA family protein [Syntrophomonas sp.]